MPRITTDIPTPDTHELVAIRRPMVGEQVVEDGPDGISVRTVTLDDFLPLAVVVRARWVWPEWLTCDAIARDSDNRWYGYLGEVHHCREGGFIADDFVRLDSGAFDFTPPPCDDWESSLRYNPHKQKGQT